MCLITRQKTPLIAEADISVKKLVTKPNLYENNPHGADYFGWYYKFFEYYKNVLYKTEMKRSDDYACFDSIAADYYFDGSFPDDRRLMLANEEIISIGQGFHAIVKDEEGNINRNINYDWGPMPDATIPAGSEYYLDETGLIVSNQIILH